MRDPQTFCIKTYGCQMNELDSEVMVGMLERRGLRRTDDEQTADILIFNTCSVRDLAERKVLGKLGQVARRRRDDPIIGITGCMASAKKETLLKKLPYIDFVLGTNNIHQLTSVLDEVISSSQRIARVDDQFSNELDYAHATRNDPLRAHVSIIRGCNKHCTYCIVPYTRGSECSRHPDDIVAECKNLVEKGYKEITLLGQNVNSYGKDRPDWSLRFPDLLARLDRIPNMCRVRFLTSHPVDMSVELMEAIRDLPTVCEFVHFPLQAGSNRILRKMNRGYTREDYEDKVAALRERVPGVAIGTDIIVGFPSETDAEFEETNEALRRLKFSAAFLFSYSPRKGTPATRWDDDVSQAEKERRLQTILTTQEEVSFTEMQQMLGTRVEVLVEGTSPKDEKMVKGRTRTWKNVVFPGSQQLLGTLQTLTLTSMAHQTFVGSLDIDPIPNHP